MFGFNKSSIDWFNSFLSERSQVVNIGSVISKPVQLNLGSPQGSILSPTIFLILLADIELYCPGATLCSYADDTSCTVAVNKIEELQEECESQASKLLEYMAINRLACNDDKTHILVIKQGQNSTEEITFKIGESEIKESPDEKLLGAWIKNDLSWSSHLKKLQDELSYRLFKLRRIEQILPKSLLKKVADGIFCSVLRYELAIFCPIRTLENDPNPTCIEGIKVIYHDVLRLLCNSKRSNHRPIESMLEQLGWLSLNQLSAEIRLFEVWKGLNKENYCMNELFEKAESNRGITRSAGLNKLKTVFRSKIRENSFAYPSVQLWSV